MGGYLLNYTRWKTLYESVSINEGVNPEMATSVEPGKLALFNEISVATKYLDSAYWKAFNDGLSKMNTNSGLTFMSSGKDINKVFDGKTGSLNFINKLLYGIYWRSGLAENKKLAKSLGIGKGSWEDFTAKFSTDRALISKLAVKASEPVSVPANFGSYKDFNGGQIESIYTIGQATTATNTKGILNITKEGQSAYQYLIPYVNSYNMLNFMNGHNEQYNLKLNDKGYFDLSVTEQIPDKLLLYSGTAPGSSVVTRTEEEGEKETVGAQTGGSGSVALGYAAMKYNIDSANKAIDANHPEVQRCVKEIVAALGDATDVKLDSITITSSASTAWQNQKMAVSNGTGDPSGGKLTTTTFTADKTAMGNQYLAWLRGKTFTDALKAALGDIAFETESINWKVSDEGLAGGKNISFEWTKKSTPGTTYTKPGGVTAKVSTTTKPSGGKSGVIYKIEVTFNKAAFGAAAPATATSEE